MPEPAAAEPALGDEGVVRLGRYHLLGSIGRGGMGQVFEAWDTQLERRVALKVLERGEDPELGLREARCLARVAHPNVVGVHEVGQAGGLVFIAMELVDGLDLRRWLRARPRRWSDVVDRILGAAHGLAAVHGAGLIHGDVKPGNVLIGGDQRVRIADFGLARVRSRAIRPRLAAAVRELADAVESEFVEHDAIADRGFGARSDGCPGGAYGDARTCGDELPGAGTRAYMAPETLLGQDPRAPADQFSLCVMAWEALFGVRPFPGGRAETVLASIAVGRIDRGRGRPRGMPRAIERILRRGLEEDPARRWESVSALARALARVRQRPRRRRWAAAVTGACALTCGLTLGLDPEVPAGPSPSCERSPDIAAAAWTVIEQGRVAVLLGAHGSVEQARQIDEGLTRWQASWIDAWRRGCGVEASVHACLEHEQLRFETIVDLLGSDRGPASLAVARVLLAELGEPAVCLLPTRDLRLEGAALAARATRAELEFRVAVTLRADDLEAGEAALARLEAALGELPAAEPDRLRLEHWRIRALTLAGRHAEASTRLRAALPSVERHGLPQLRFRFLLDQARLTQARGESALDELATLRGLVERAPLDGWDEVELAAVEANELEPPEPDVVAWVEGLDSRWAAELGREPRLSAELGLARARLHLRAGHFNAAIADAGEVLGLAGAAPARSVQLQARVLLALASARAGDCEVADRAVADLHMAIQDGGARAQELGWLLDVVHALPTTASSVCVAAERSAWTLITKVGASPRTGP